jgi:predicted DNA-binding ribbon-helix-helix protein
MKSFKRRTIYIDGHKTTISLEDAFWTALKEIAQERGESPRHLINSIDANRRFANLSSATRLFVLEFYKEQLDRIEQQEISVQQPKRRKRREPLTRRA